MGNAVSTHFRQKFYKRSDPEIDWAGSGYSVLDVNKCIYNYLTIAAVEVEETE
jgi:hypothetical protein